mmetsp:Transcript_28108/g.45569  ORF Transcript_28108/g.45569 Transcript_28108/m.45569 type:complete len:106 (+) Transcript_28108:1143-1460(+)
MSPPTFPSPVPIKQHLPGRYKKLCGKDILSNPLYHLIISSRSLFGTDQICRRDPELFPTSKPNPDSVSCANSHQKTNSHQNTLPYRNPDCLPVFTVYSNPTSITI